MQIIPIEKFESSPPSGLVEVALVPENDLLRSDWDDRCANLIEAFDVGSVRVDSQTSLPQVIFDNEEPTTLIQAIRSELGEELGVDNDVQLTEQSKKNHFRSTTSKLNGYPRF